jgi:glutaredoxin
MMKGIFLLMGLLIMTNAQAGELYRWVDRDGKVHYGDMPQPGTEDLEQLKLGKEPAPDESLPYETQRAMQNFPVTLYAFPDCGQACQKARDFLNKRGIPFTEKSLLSQEDIDTFRKASGDSQLPAATVGKTWLKGFQEEQWNSELDFAGYPKRVLKYRPSRPATPPAQPAQ